MALNTKVPRRVTHKETFSSVNFTGGTADVTLDSPRHVDGTEDLVVTAANDGVVIQPESVTENASDQTVVTLHAYETAGSNGEMADSDSTVDTIIVRSDGL